MVLKNKGIYMKKTLLALSLFTSFAAFAQTPDITKLVANQPTLKAGQEACVYHNFAGMPQLNLGAQNNKVMSERAANLCRMGYYSYYDPVTKTPMWVSENLDNSKLLPPKDVIGDFFRADPDLPATIPQATLNDYKGTGFVPGHLAPSEEMNSTGNNQNAKNLVINQSLYFTNMMPMVSANMDKGIWLDIETQIRTWASTRQNLLVVTGPIYDNKTSPVTIGPGKVWVPTRMYKVVFNAMTGKSIAFVVPNVQVITAKTKALDPGVAGYSQTLNSSAYNCGKVCAIENFRTSVAEVEKITGLKFFPNAKGVNFTTISPSDWPVTP
jgi:DNA/RNA endonuclease G (NUC1)